MDEDWRLWRGQKGYLSGATLIWQSYKPNGPYNDHDHCEFCMTKFGKGINDLHQGYSTEDGEVWICSQCYSDFNSLFGWHLRQK